jgi:hypothetical protein
MCRRSADRMNADAVADHPRQIAKELREDVDTDDVAREEWQIRSPATPEIEDDRGRMAQLLDEPGNGRCLLRPITGELVRLCLGLPRSDQLSKCGRQEKRNPVLDRISAVTACADERTGADLPVGTTLAFRSERE